MKAVIQTVSDCTCTVSERVISHIEKGLLIYYGVEKDDREEMIVPFIEKILRLRIYRGEDDRKMTDSIMDRTKEVMIISQFTLAGDLTRGNRPSFDNAMNPSDAEAFYNRAVEVLKERGVRTAGGVFGAHMMIKYTNDGPETFFLEK